MHPSFAPTQRRMSSRPALHGLARHLRIRDDGAGHPHQVGDAPPQDVLRLGGMDNPSRVNHWNAKGLFVRGDKVQIHAVGKIG